MKESRIVVDGIAVCVRSWIDKLNKADSYSFNEVHNAEHCRSRVARPWYQ